MKNVIICGDGGSKVLTRTVVRACEAYGGAFVYDGAKIYETNDDPSYMVLGVGGISEVTCGGIIVFGRSPIRGAANFDTGSLIAVVDGENTRALSVLLNSGKPAIGCSMSAHDTLSISGGEGNVRQLCLSRSVTTLDGHIIEPCEFPVTIQAGTPIYPILAAACILLLSGIDCSEGYCF